MDHKRTFLHLEQLILKHNAHAQALQIQVGHETGDLPLPSFVYPCMCPPFPRRVVGRSVVVAALTHTFPPLVPQSFKDGMDFYYAERNQAARFTEFLEAVCPLKVKQSKKLVGQDDHSNLFNFKYTTIVEIVPVRGACVAGVCVRLRFV